jgi:N-acetylmuramoyl-L-alanine amidase
MRASRPKPGGSRWKAAWWKPVCVAAALLLSGTLAKAAPTSAVVSGGVGLLGVRFGGDAGTTRVVLDLDAAVVGKVLAGEGAERRVVIALPSLLSAQALRGPGQGLVLGWAVQDDVHGARLVLDLRPGAILVRRFLIPPPAVGGHWRYVVDVADGDPLAVLVADASRAADSRSRLTLAAAIPPPRGAGSSASATLLLASGPPAAKAAPFASPVPGAAVAGGVVQGDPSLPRATPAVLVIRPAGARAQAGRSQKVIVVDAGHGGHDPGARSLVRNEKDITLAAALALKARLEKLGRYKVVLTRDTDVFIPLETRVQIARHAGADLFISLHADSAGTDPTPHGASVYTLSDSGQTRVNYVLGPHEWFGRAGDKRTDPGVRQILLDLTQRSTRNRSSQFASILIDHITQRVDLLPRTHRDAGYFVLLAPDVPAVLLEMGFITNPGDELRLTDPVQREALMGGVADAIDSYFTGAPRLASD